MIYTVGLGSFMKDFLLYLAMIYSGKADDDIYTQYHTIFSKGKCQAIESSGPYPINSKSPGFALRGPKCICVALRGSWNIPCNFLSVQVSQCTDGSYVVIKMGRS